MSAEPIGWPKYLWTARFLALVVFGLGCLGLFNWVFHEALSFPFHSDVTMKTNTAIGLITLAVAVALLSLPGHAQLARTGRLLGLLVSVLGFLTFLEHLFRIDLGIDQLLFTEPPGAPATVSPNRMGPPASLLFLILGQVLLWIPSSPTRGRNVQWLALVALAIALVPLAGHLFGATDLYAVSQLTGIAPHTALGLALIAVAVVLLRPDRPPMELLRRLDAGGAMARRLVPATLLLPPLVGWLVVSGHDAGLFDIPVARVLMQLLIVVPMLAMVWWTARHLSALEQARDMAQQRFVAARLEAEELGAQYLETTNLLDRLLDNAPVGFAAMDRRARYLRVNRYLAELNRLEVDAHIGKNIQEIVPEHGERFEGLIAEVFRSGQPLRNVEVEIHGEAPEQTRHFACEVFPVPGRGGSVSLVGLLVMETTEQKRLDAQQAAVLEREQQARAESERVSLLKDEFLATLSHELRTPLTSIIGWAQILRRKTPEPHDLERGLETIDRNSQSLSQLINDLLDVSRIVNGKLHLNMLLLNIQSVVIAAMDSVAPSAQVKGVALNRRADIEPLLVNGDPSRLQQIVSNLLTNAVKFTPRGGRIEVGVERRGENVAIIVKDTGVGVKPEFLPHMFQRFRQADASTTRRFGGLGLGLSIVRQLAELHGGGVEVESDGEHRGTTFTVTLPLATSPELPDDPDPPVRFDVNCLDGVRVLVVDDEPDACDLVARVMEQNGATVSRAANVDDAIQRVETDRPQILISDLGMPGKDGYELIRLLRDTYAPETLPAIALTAFARPADQARSILAGFQVHVGKPIAPDELVRAVITLVRNGHPKAV